MRQGRDTIDLIIEHQTTSARREYSEIGRELLTRTDDKLAVAYVEMMVESHGAMTSEDATS